MRWRLILEEYGPDLRYIQGEKNVVADALSRLEMTEDNPAQLLNQMDIVQPKDFQTKQDRNSSINIKLQMHLQKKRKTKKTL